MRADHRNDNPTDSNSLLLVKSNGQAATLMAKLRITIAQALWIGLFLSIAIGVGSYMLLMWGEMVFQLLTAPDKHFWYLSRASGVIAYTLFWLAVVFGLLLSTRLSKRFNAARVFSYISI